MPGRWQHGEAVYGLMGKNFTKHLNRRGWKPYYCLVDVRSAEDARLMWHTIAGHDRCGSEVK